MQNALPVRLPAPPRAPHQRSLALTSLFVVVASGCAASDQDRRYEATSSRTNAPVTKDASNSTSTRTLPRADAPVTTGRTETYITPTTLVVEDLDDRRYKPWEITLGGRGTNDEHYMVGGGQINGSVGYYLTEVVEIAVRQGVSYSDDLPGAAGAETSEVWNFDTRIALDLHLPMGDFVPYIGGNVGGIYGDSSNDSFAAGPEVGIKWYVKDDAFVHVGAEYEFFFESDESAADAFDQGQVFYSAGLGLRF